MVKRIGMALAIVVIATAPALASDGTTTAESIARVCLFLALILGGAKIGAELATRLGQPAVLGELLFGVLLGNLSLLGVTALEPIKHDAAVELLAQLGVIILLFEVGLESTVAQMLRVGLSSFLVATIGVVTPFALGWLVSKWLLPQASEYVHAFLGAALTATSVGITARVLKDLDRSQTDEARIILGAAVIDDVMGLIVLAVVAGVIAAADHGTTVSSNGAAPALRGGAATAFALAMILVKAVVFLVGALVIGVNISPRVFALASRLRSRGVLLVVGLTFCFVLASIAGAIGLAPIVGAFAAGLILEQVHYRDFTDRGEHQLEELVQPIASFLVPVFFVLMGMHTDLASFLHPSVLGLAFALIAAAIIGKQACYFGVTGKGIDRLTVGIGMIPRGEVGLIFANMGLGLTVRGERVVDAATYSAVVIVVIATTLVTPPLLKWSVNRPGRTRPTAPASTST